MSRLPDRDKYPAFAKVTGIGNKKRFQSLEFNSVRSLVNGVNFKDAL